MTTVVFFHAHPDDEALLTGGTLAMLSADGHRVVVVVASDGIMGPADSGRPGGGRSRLDELHASASVLGVARVVHLGYADSGHGPVLIPDPPDRTRFVRADLSEAATRLTAVLHEENAGLLVSYDQAGGYGHRDHVRVHQVGALAADMARTVRLLEATFPREPVAWLAVMLRPSRLVVGSDTRDARASFTPRSAITHRVDVRDYAAQKRAALAAHQSQAWPAATGRAARTFWVLTRLPLPLFRLLLGREYFTERGAPQGTSRSRIL